MPELARLWSALAALLFPSRCLGCGRRDVDLCASCRAALPRLPERRCPTCAASPGTLGVCDDCRSRDIALDGVRVEYAFTGAVRTAIHRLKYRHGTYLVPTLRDLCLDALTVRPLAPDAIAAVPISPKRLRQRGYNQSQLIAEAVGTATGTIVIQALTRIREGQSQTRLDAIGRRENVRGAFALAPAIDVEGRRLLLVDDVMTTGATLNACAAALKSGGAAQVFGLVAAKER